MNACYVHDTRTLLQCRPRKPLRRFNEDFGIFLFSFFLSFVADVGPVLCGISSVRFNVEQIHAATPSTRVL